MIRDPINRTLRVTHSFDDSTRFLAISVKHNQNDMNRAMNRLLNSLILLAISLPFALPTSVARGQESATATQAELKLSVNVPGVFVADDKDEMKMEPIKYSGDLIVTRILPEGTKVKTGDVLMEFDSDMVDEAIDEAQNEATDADVELKKAQAEYQSAQIDLEAKQYQLEAELKMLQSEVSAAGEKQLLDLAEQEQKIVDAEHQLEQAKIDFKTLEELYDERGLVESNSGDILMDRERKKISNMVKGIEFAKKELNYFKQFDKSKEQIEKELEVEKKQAEIKKETINLAAVATEKKSIVEKAQRKVDAANRKVDGLKKDREQLRVVSPREGTLFYGSTGNELPAGVIVMGMPDSRAQLRIGGRIKTHSVLLTVSTMSNLSIKMNLAENDIQHVKQDLPITIYPDAFPSLQFKGKLSQVDQIATKIGFGSNSPRRFKVMGKCTEDANLLRSGMNCRVEIHPDPFEKVLQIPLVSVFEEDGDFYCYVKGDSGSEKRKIEIGLSNVEFVEVKSGLNEGEVVLLKRPSQSDLR